MLHEVVVYSLSGCPHCKALKTFLDNDNIPYTNIDVGEDQKAAAEMIKISGQRGVPVTVIDGEKIVVGDDLKKVMEYLGAPVAVKKTPDVSPNHDLVVIGAGAAGLSAAMYGARKGMDMIVITGAIGGMVSQSYVVENYPGVPDVSGEELMKKIYDHTVQSGGIFVEDVVTGISKIDDIFSIETLNGGPYTAKAVIAATGRSPRLSGAKGETEYLGKGVAICTTCDGPLYKNKVVGILGGGNTAVDMAIELSDIASTIHLIVRSHLKADKVLIDRLKTKKNVVLHKGSTISEFGGGQFLEYVVLKKTGGVSALLGKAEEKLPVDGVFLGIGLDPNTSIFEGFAAMNPNKEIIVDVDCTTNVPGFFAAGDATSIKAKQIATSVGEGIKALLSAYDYLRR
ncbi:MAG: FAD-dependent oxidoreductase [Methanocorpusculum sp.]|uniref:FAD-dependent oxidoreductase n=1 Tax=Methanocorpusculum sp. TaxID=2058474 RepID=UPI0027264E35|nr:FAD-dependent oxidoreductase [Methanocorpusculum sp.]MDO9523292.1 FAD-dependent oxidoreductase [Methanocorpusculum sp.]